jgi:hypothetical protein
MLPLDSPPWYVEGFSGAGTHVSHSWKQPLDISLAWISFCFLALVPLSPYCLNGVSWHGELNFIIITWPKPPTPPWCPTKLLLARGWFNPNKKACHSPPLRDLHLHRCFDMLTCYGESFFCHFSPKSSFGVSASNFRFICVKYVFLNYGRNLKTSFVSICMNSCDDFAPIWCHSFWVSYGLLT